MNNRRPGGFALPTVLTASIIMMIVLLSAVSSTAAVRMSIREQYFNQLSRNASDAGLSYAKACLSKSGGVATWSDVSPLKPGTDCSGAQIAGFDCSTTPTDSRCVMTYGNNILSSFTVGSPEASIFGWAVSDDKNIETFSEGSLHSCGITVSGNAYCWGSGANGELGNGTNSRTTLSPSAVSGSYKFKSISAGLDHTCALTVSGDVYCWGLATSGQLGNGSSTGSSNVPAAVLTTNLTGDKKFKSISSGNSHTCGVATDNKAYCWGMNNNGQIGNGNTGTNYNIPTPVTTSGALNGKSVLAVSLGGEFSCAIATSGSSGSTTAVYCWGYNNYGQLGNTSNTTSNSPVAVTASGALNGKSAFQISAGGDFACVLAGSNASDQAVYCWGYGADGRLGNSGTANYNYPVTVTASGVLSGLSISSVDSGSAHSCVVASNGKAYCWGNNVNGQLGDGGTATSTSPVAVKNTNANDAFYGKTILSINSGNNRTCAIASDDRLYCWGNNTSTVGDDGMLGDNTATNQTAPVAVYTSAMTKTQVVTVTSKGYTNILRTSNSSVWQSYKAFSKHSYADRVWKQVSTGLRHQCGLTNDGQIYCWGDNTFGQLGDGTTTDRSSPTSIYTGTSSSPGVIYGKSFLSVQASERFTCALSTDYNVYCWGDNYNGELGNGSSVSYSNVPVAVQKSQYSNKAVVSMSVGRFHICIITSARAVYCWGNNGSGQLGNNSTTSSNIPVTIVSGGLSVLSLASGANFTCGIASDNNIYCWGAAAAGQLGDNTTTVYSMIPVALYTSGVLSGKEVISLYGGYQTSYVIASDGLAYSWGDDTYGSLGNNDTFVSYNYPVAISTTNIGTKTFASIAVGFVSACGLTNDANLYCWGRNHFSQLAESTLLDKGIPTQSTISAVTSGNYLTNVVSSSFGMTYCSSATDTNTYCWGGGIMSNGIFDSDFYASRTSSNVLIPINQPGSKIY